MFKIRKILFLFLIPLTLEAKDFAKGFLRHQVNLGLTGFNIKEDSLISSGAATNVEGDFLYGVEEGLKLRLNPVASFISGQQISRDPLSPLSNSIYLKEASLEKQLEFDWSLKAGVLYQKEFLPAISGYTKAFPGIGILAPFKSGEHLIEIRAQAAVPASSGLATTSTELESSASLYSASAFIKSSWTNIFSTTLSFSRFGFSKLSSAAATESINRGNTVVSPSVSSKAFVYKYEGNEITFGGDYKGELLVFNFLTSFIKNDSAPKKLNQGYFFSISPGYVYSTKNILRPVFDHYHVEGDAMVAAYSDTTYGRTNRDGYRYGLALENEKYRIVFIYADSKLIQENPFQSADKAYFINLSLDHLL